MRNLESDIDNQTFLLPQRQIGARLFDDVLQGPDRELYHAGVKGELFYIMGGTKRVDNDKVARFRNAIDERAAVCAKHGTKYRHVIVPEKMSLHADRILDEPIQFVGDRFTDFGRFMPDHILYPRAELTDLDRFHRVYARDHAHMAAHGVILCTDLLLKSLGVPFTQHQVRAIHGTINPIKQVGELARRFGPSLPIELAWFRWPSDAAHFVNHRKTGQNAQIHIAPGAVNQGRVLLVGTSSLIPMGRLMSRQFTEVVFVSERVVSQRLLDRLRPDILISGTIERLLLHWPMEDDPNFNRFNAQTGAWGDDVPECFQRTWSRLVVARAEADEPINR